MLPGHSAQRCILDAPIGECSGRGADGIVVNGSMTTSSVVAGCGFFFAMVRTFLSTC